MDTRFTPRPRRLYLTTDSELLGVSLTRGEISRYASPDRFTLVAELDDGFLAAGPSAVAVYGSDRAPLWVFRVPTTEPLPARSGAPHLSFGNDPTHPELSSFLSNGRWLFARLGERHLIALALHEKRVAWVLSADGTNGYRPVALPNALNFGPTFGASGRHLLVQLSDGRRRFVAAETGRVTTELDDRTAKVWWRHRPGEVEANMVLIPDGVGLVRMVDLSAGVEKWKHQVDGETSLTGDPPQVAAMGDTVLLAARRNHGVELDRLDPLDGRSLWTSGAAFIDADDATLAHADADSERIVIPVGDSLVAVALETGKTLWKAKLPDTSGAGGCGPAGA